MSGLHLPSQFIIMKYSIYLFMLMGGITLKSQAQTKPIDTVLAIQKPMQGYLNEVIITTNSDNKGFFPDVLGSNIYAGKKTHVVQLDQIQANVVNNSMRQILAKVPGIQIWESDASGIQVGVSARGLSPNRSWEFNVRQNGIDIAADPFGYPEAYFNPPMQAVQQIQVVRGAGALQYGPQFGGMLNYVLKNGSDIYKKIQFESSQTIGSYGMFNSFNAIGGSGKKVHYYVMFDHRNGDGWRENSRYNTNTSFATINYQLNKKVKIGAEMMLYDMLSQQAGGLTDSSFERDAQKSSRARNYMSTPWAIGALNMQWNITDMQKLNVKVYTSQGDRNSVGYLGTINIADTIKATTREYNNRELLADKYRNYGMETKYLNQYTLGGQTQTLSMGVKAYTGSTHRQQKGKGTTGSDYNMDLVDAYYPNQLDFVTKNASLYAEHLFKIGNKLSIVPGMRYEYINMTADGRLGFNTDSTEIRINSESRTRSKFLAGIGISYKMNPIAELYANYTQAYRPMLFSDLTASPTTDVIDPELKDANGYNLDLGCRGSVKQYLTYDVSAYLLQYNNRIGTITQQRTDKTFYNYRTNVGNSVSKGLEALVQLDIAKMFWPATRQHTLSAYASYGYTQALYSDFVLVSKDAQNNLVSTNYTDKKVENAPEHILRSGITYGYHKAMLTCQISHVSKAYSNANNTEKPTADGNNGLIPAYTVADVVFETPITKQYKLKAGINNLMDARYFTRRSGGYPGPGLLPADGRTVFATFEVKL